VAAHTDGRRADAGGFTGGHAMAIAKIAYQFTTGETLQISFEAVAEHPDALDEIATRVVRIYREAMDVDDDADLET